MEVLASTQVSVKKEDQRMFIFSSALNKISISPKHDIKSMAQCVAS
jgi:hypothetical protein